MNALRTIFFAASLVFTFSPSISVAFENVTADPGATIVLAPTLPVTGVYQWKLNGNEIPNATSTSLTLDAITQNESGTYRIEVSDAPDGAVTYFEEGAVTVLPSSVVRFQTAFGPIDLQLFDRVKPITVRNFLRYVRAGAYTNVFFHRLDPNFVLQGGGFISPARDSTNAFGSYNNATNFGTIINEFSTTTHITNRYGTIAMAKKSNQPDSASSQWFFNLADNLNLDALNGGFTVFGRVINGTNVLEQFKTHSLSNGIVNMTSFFGSGASVFNELPVRFTGYRVPNFNELYLADISILESPIIAPWFNLQTVGLGSVTPVLPTNVVFGKSYQLKATPNAGQLFVGWSGGTNSVNPVLRFRMPYHLDLTATFASNHFPKVFGNYSGLFYETGQVAVASSGSLNLKVTAGGAFSGKVLIGGATLSCKGKFNHLGATTFFIARRGAAPLSLTLNLDLTNGINQITGFATDGVWSAPVLERRNFLLETGIANSYAKKLTMNFPGTQPGLQQPGGDGFASVSIASNGVVKVAGVLGDDEKLSITTARAGDGYWPFYKSLYRGGGVIVGWISNLETNEQPLAWIKSASSTQKTYLNGFAVPVSARLSTNGFPETGSYNVALTGGGIFGTPALSQVTFDANNRFTVVQSGIGLKIFFVPASGFLKGSFIHPVNGKTVPWKGAFFKSDETGNGFYLNAPQSGFVHLFKE